MLKQVSRKGEGVIKKRNMLEVVKQKDPGREWRAGVLGVFEGAKKSSVRDSNAGSKYALRVCDYYVVIKKPTKTLKPKTKKKKSHGKSWKSSWLFFCITDHKQSLVKAVSITIQICMPCFWLANSSPPWGGFRETFWKYKCKFQKLRRSMKNGECSRGFVMALQNGSRVWTPRLEDVSEMAFN